MNSLNANFFPRSTYGNFNVPVFANRLVILGNLIALWQIGIEIVFSREDRHGLHRAVEREGGARRELDGVGIQDRQRAGQREAYRAGVAIGRCSILRGAPERVQPDQEAALAVQSLSLQM